MNIRSTKLIAAIVVLSAVSASLPGWARPGADWKPGSERRIISNLKSTAAACDPATATIDLDINNVRSRLMTGGDMWWDRGSGTAKYEIPKGSGKNSLFAGSVWVGGKDRTGNLKVMAQQYRVQGNDTWPGPTLTDGNGQNIAPTRSTCSDWDRFWKIDNATLQEFIEAQKGGTVPTDAKYQTILEWPATGNTRAVGNSGLPLDQLNDPNYLHFGRNYAPFVDQNKNGIYELDQGDYPDIFGDQYIWWVFNDMGNVKLQTGTNAIGMEVQTASFAYATKDYLNDATFVYYKLINRGTLTLDSTYMATWTDADLGFASDDYIGCDTGRSLGILYNGKSRDGNGEPASYGAQVPMIGVDFFQGPKRRTYNNNRDSYYVHPATDGVRFFHEDTLGMAVFNYFTNGDADHGDPRDGLGTYRVMTGYSILGKKLHNDKAQKSSSSGFTNVGPEVDAVFYDNPEDPNGWSECACGTKSGDRRFVHSSGPFTLEAGGITNDIIIGACWVPNVGGCPTTNFSRIRAADDAIQDLFDNHFRTIEGPEAPRLVIREMDRKLVFYLVNDPNSTNYEEKFGFDTGKYRVSTPRTRKLAKNGDSIYTFQGYRVFQLKDRTVNVANIYKEDGSVNSDVAQEVFESDIKDTIAGNVVNVTGIPDILGGAYNVAKKVSLQNTGIQHSFVLTTDKFATIDDKRFVNYRNYYFVAVAFAYNNFKAYNGSNADSAQLTQYLESAHSAGVRPIPIYTPMPNPANGDMGTVLNSDYGSGVIVKRLEGIGNGGNAATIDSQSEQQALSGPAYQSYQPTFRPDESPINVKIVDPIKVQPKDWELYLVGPSNVGDPGLGLVSTQTKWTLKAVGDTDVIYSERMLNVANEQILEKYGLSITINQTLRPGDDGVPTNGYINSSLIYSDPNKAWLAGVPDGEEQSPLNWIRSGGFAQPLNVTCNYADVDVFRNPDNTPSDHNLDHDQVYEGLLSEYTPNKGTWAPVSLTAVEGNANCGFGVAYREMQKKGIKNLPSVDIVMTSDKSKWSKVPVIELEDEPSLAEGGATKFGLRQHASWTGNVNADGSPIYSTSSSDYGMSYFPGYAINQETGERLNIIFGEDSYLKSHNGADMIWNPTSTIFDSKSGSVVFGGKHYIYILDSKYDEGAKERDMLLAGITGNTINETFQWIGLPIVQPGQPLLSLKDGLIPTETRVRFRVTKPYAQYQPDGFPQAYRNNGLPLFSFTTKGLAPTALNADGNPNNNDKQSLLDQIHVTPNPYYGYASYELSNLDSRVRIVNLPRTATVNIYALDGALIRTLTKDNANVSYVDWDLRNAKGLAIASGMYLIHVKAEGIGETVIRWFGAFRPINITTY